MPSLLTDDDRPPVPGSRPRVNRGLIAASVLAVVVLAVATFVAFTGDGPSQARPPVLELDGDTPFPGALEGGRDVTGQNVAGIRYEGLGGSPGGDLGSFAGTPLVINFFASWCVPCIEEMPAFEAVYQERLDEVAFIGLNLSEQADTALLMVQRTGVTYQIGSDPRGDVLEAFGAINMPTTVFVDAAGAVVRVHSGKLSQIDLDRIIDEDLLS
jgi:thiol-disulfide isomerase/thioredoxin